MRKFLRNNSCLIVILLLYIFVIFLFSDHVPLWDAWRSIDIWIKGAIFSRFNLLNFENAGHPSGAYYLPMSLLQYFDFGNQFYLHFTSTLMGITMIIFFYKIIRILFSQTEDIEIYLLTAIFAFFPIFLSNQLHIGPDYGVLVFFIIFLYFFLAKKITLAVIAACFLMFTKEAGILLYGATLVSFSFTSMMMGKFSINSIIKQLKKNSIYLLPPIFFGVRILYLLFILHKKALWITFNSSPDSIDFALFPPAVNQNVPLSYFLGIFVLNFNWILTIFTFLGFIEVFFRRVKSSSFYLKHIFTALYLEFILSYILLTFIRTFTNVRYFLPLYALMIIFSYIGIRSIIKTNLVRRLSLLVVFLIFFISNFNTLDPLSKKIWGTFRFGNHDFLKMTSITGECCGYGRDQLVYNLEYIYFSRLQDKFYEDVKLTSGDAIAYHPIDAPEIIGRIEVKNHRRTARIAGSFEPYVVTYLFPSLPVKPDRIYYLAFPNVDNKETLGYYLTYYRIEKVTTYEENGYALNVYSLKLKS